MAIILIWQFEKNENSFFLITLVYAFTQIAFCWLMLLLLHNFNGTQNYNDIAHHEFKLVQDQYFHYNLNFNRSREDFQNSYNEKRIQGKRLGERLGN
jgi:hypothetical protein